jgi:amidase
VDAVDLAFADIARQAELIRSGEVSARELTEVYLERISRHDPRINAFRIVFAERALAEADQADARRRAGEERPLLGVPIAIKDDCDVAGEVTAFGTNAFDGPAPADAEVVRRLRGAGAVILGKTNVPELVFLPFTESPTWGVTRNPWDLDRTPGGSSGGSAAAVAAGLVGAALGSDGAGSIRIPAACCGLPGLKPQRGRVPTAPRIEPFNGLSVPGPLTRTVYDAALLLDAVKDGGPSLVAAAASPVERLRVAVTYKVPVPALRLAPEQRRAVEDTVELLRELGHDVVERDPEYVPATTAAVAARYLRGIHEQARFVPRPERLTRRTRGYVRMGAAVRPAALARARAAEASDAAHLNRPLEQADVLLTPMFTRRPPRVGEYEGRSAVRTFNGTARFVPFCAAWNHTGQPAIAVPAGHSPDGFPLAVQLVGRPDDESTLLRLAAQLEARRGWPDLRPPLFEA